MRPRPLARQPLSGHALIGQMIEVKIGREILLRRKSANAAGSAADLVN